MTDTEKAALCARIDELCAENERLRGQGEQLFDKTLELGTENAKLRELVYGAANEADRLTHDAAALQIENAKLRELCKMFAMYVSQDRCEGCVVKRRCNEGDVEECWQRTEIRKVASELGVEVD